MKKILTVILTLLLVFFNRSNETELRFFHFSFSVPFVFLALGIYLLGMISLFISIRKKRESNGDSGEKKGKKYHSSPLRFGLQMLFFAFLVPLVYYNSETGISLYLGKGIKPFQGNLFAVLLFLYLLGAFTVLYQYKKRWSYRKKEKPEKKKDAVRASGG